MRLAALCVLATAAFAAPAGAYWSAGGTGSGSGSVVTMPAGQQPSASADGQAVSVTWTQSTLLGSAIGAYLGGGYTVARYVAGGSTPATPNASCTITGAGTTLTCVEAGVPYGSWQYTVTPVLGSLTGEEGPKSAAVSVATDAPVLNSATAQNPTSEQTTGGIELSWAPAGGATGYNVYRRTSDETFNFADSLNGATPISAGTTYTDAGSGLAAATTYHYVVRAVAGSPAVESPSSNSVSTATISRPAAPTGVTATAAPAARIDVAWTGVADVAGYNVYRRTAAGTYDFATPLNGSTPLATIGYADLTALNATGYHYTVRSVITGSGSVQVESANSTESPLVTADGLAPPVPTATSVTSGGNVWNSTDCSMVSGTRYINIAGRSSVGVSTTITTPEPGQAVVFSATTSGSTPVTATVAATGTTVTTTLDLSSLLDGTVTLTARTMDLAGNLSAPRAPANVVIKDTVVPTLTANYTKPLIGSAYVSGTSECRATIIAVRVGDPSQVFSTIASTNGSYSVDVSSSLLGLTSVSYDVTATDRAGNVSLPRRAT